MAGMPLRHARRTGTTPLDRAAKLARIEAQRTAARVEAAEVAAHAAAARVAPMLAALAALSDACDQAAGRPVGAWRTADLDRHDDDAGRSTEDADLSALLDRLNAQEAATLALLDHPEDDAAVLALLDDDPE